MTPHGRAEDMSQQLRTEADAEHGLALLERALDRVELGLQVRPAVLILDVHGPAENDEAAVAIDVRLGVGVALEVVETNPMPACTNQRIERSERLDGDVLKDEQPRHRSTLPRS